jgi:hypothetical protein
MKHIVFLFSSTHILYLNAYPEVTGIYRRFNKNSILDTWKRRKFAVFFVHRWVGGQFWNFVCSISFLDLISYQLGQALYFGLDWNWSFVAHGHPAKFAVWQFRSYPTARHTPNVLLFLKKNQMFFLVSTVLIITKSSVSVHSRM